MGYLHRSVFSTLLSSPAEDHDDLEWDMVENESIDETTTVLVPSTHHRIALEQYVVYSPTYQVPVLYFTASAADGSTISITDLAQSSFFQHPDESFVNSTTQSVMLPHPSDSSDGNTPTPFPLLTQGDHPTLGTPCWYIHPCETSSAVDALLTDGFHELDGDARLVRWLKVWFMVLGSVVRLVDLIPE